jgi:AraC-like DNA-binding protein
MTKKRIQQRLKLVEKEVRLIKALVQCEEMNDQMVQSMFSHLGRTINHREIGYIRTGHIKYNHIDAASEQEKNEFITRYKRAEITLKQSGLVPAEPYFERLCKSRESMLAAISIHNNPNIDFKTEIFITNAMIAWTYLVHAYLETIKECFHYDEQKTKHGQKKYFELGKCIRLNACKLNKHTKNNLEYLLEVRHEIEHRMTKNIDASISSKIQACVLNYNEYIALWFGAEYRIDHLLPFSVQMSEISLEQYNALKGKRGLPAIIETINKSFEDELSDKDVADPRYSYKVFLIPRTSNRENSADQAAEFVHPNSKKGRDFQFAIKEVEKRKFIPSEIVKMMKSEGYRWFRMHEFVQFWKSIDGKNKTKGFGVQIGYQWFWYEHLIPLVREYCQKHR